jgi:predicted TIM-barrel fold metal-dependent hydrolase
MRAVPTLNAAEGDAVIIDAHAHVNAPPELYAYQASLLASRGTQGRSDPGISDSLVEEYGQRTIAVMDSVGTDMQLISPRPFSMLHSAQPSRVVHWWIAAMNDFIARQVRMFPDRLAAVAALPQSVTESPADWLHELDRAVTDLGAVGCLLNPDPGEGQQSVPSLGDPWWYPLYERLVELDVPALVHSAGCANGRESYSEHFITEETIAVLSLVNSAVFQEFPTLKVIISHGGGSVPYQIGRWRAARLHPRLKQANAGDENFDDGLRQLWFDTVLHYPLALELLFRTVGPDRCVFGTEKPGSGSAYDPVTQHDFDDLKPVIEAMPFLSDLDRAGIFEGNARSLFRLEA